MRALQRRLRVTALYVTHDQGEAMTLGDRVVVMRAGRIQQVGVPAAVYERPANAFVAGFIGTPPMNLLPARLTSDTLMVGEQRLVLPPAWRARLHCPDGALLVGVRPEAFGVGERGTGLEVVIDPGSAEILGSETLAQGRVGGEPVTVRLAGLVRDLPARLRADFDSLHFFAADDAGARLTGDQG